jgi:hypothetical protein
MTSAAASARFFCNAGEPNASSCDERLGGCGLDDFLKRSESGMMPSFCLMMALLQTFRD